MPRWIRKLLKASYLGCLRHGPGLRNIYDSLDTPSPILPRMLFMQKGLGFNRRVPWPVHFTSRVSGWQFIEIGIAVAPGFEGGCYIFASRESPISIGDYTIISANVCLAGYNHDLYDYTKFPSKGGIKVGRYCWIGMNASVMPGTELGDHTVVAAGSVVTRSFPNGYCVVGGVPARLIKHLDPSKTIERRSPNEFIGFRRVNSK